MEAGSASPTPKSKSEHPTVMEVCSEEQSRSASPTLSLEVYRRKQSRGRIMACEAREQHCSTMAEGFAGRTSKNRTKDELRTKLRAIIAQFGSPELADQYLAVAVGNMLERIVSWDRDRAESTESMDMGRGLLLSTVPKANNINDVDARYLIDTFRRAMATVPATDFRFQIGQLPEKQLFALLHFTFLISRPVLAWELDLDEIME